MKLLIGKEVGQLSGCLIFLFVPIVVLLLSCNRREPLRPLVITAQDSAENLLRIKRAFVKIQQAKKDIRSGDLVTRTGNDFTSESLRKLNRRNKTYSHCGIASIENDSLFVYHALGGEWNPDAKLRRDRWEVFAEPFSNKGVGHFRYAIDDNTIAMLMRLVQRHHREGLPFDMQFDLATDDRMYCAEFISKTFSLASDNRLQFGRSHINNFEFIGVDDLFLQENCRKIAGITYK